MLWYRDASQQRDAIPWRPGERCFRLLTRSTGGAGKEAGREDSPCYQTLLIGRDLLAGQ